MRPNLLRSGMADKGRANKGRAHTWPDSTKSATSRFMATTTGLVLLAVLLTALRKGRAAAGHGEGFAMVGGGHMAEGGALHTLRTCTTHRSNQDSGSVPQSGDRNRHRCRLT